MYLVKFRRIKGVSLSDKKLEELKRRISEHLYNEAQIMVDILEVGLSAEEFKELSAFMKSHPYHEAYTCLKEIQSKVRLRK